MASERVQKILAQAGIASRRKAEEMIEEGLVTINGKLAKLGDKADLENDSIKVKGKLLRSKEPPVYVAFFKPKGVISALSDPEGRASLADFLSKIKARVYPIGRLDFNSEGLLLLTNDGAFAEKLQKMEGVPRVYHVKVRGRPEASMIAGLEKGARVGNRLVKPQSIRLAEELANKIRVEVVFTDSGAVDVKSLFEQKGFLVEAIRRTAIGQITLRGLEPGHFRFLKASQVEAILSHPELGIRALPERGRPAADGQGFRYRKPQGERVEAEAAPAVESEPGGGRRTRSGAAPVIAPKKSGSAPRTENRKPRFGGGKPSFGDRKPRVGGVRSEKSFEDRKPRFGGTRSEKSFEDLKPRFGGPRPEKSFEDRKPRFGSGKPSFGGGKPAFGKGRDRDTRGGESRGGYGTSKPSFGSGIRVTRKSGSIRPRKTTDK